MTGRKADTRKGCNCCPTWRRRGRAKLRKALARVHRQEIRTR